MLLRQALHYQSIIDYFEYVKDWRYPLLFDSQGSGRFDILLADPVRVWLTNGAETRIYDHEDKLLELSTAHPFDLLARELPPSKQIEVLENVPFAGGLAGLLGYDLAWRNEAMPKQKARQYQCPDLAVGLYDWSLVVDHQEKCALLLSADAHIASTKWQRLSQTFSSLKPSAEEVMDFPYLKGCLHTSAKDYESAFLAVKAHLAKGDCYQVNLTQRFDFECQHSGFELYKMLRSKNQAAFGGYFKCGISEILSFSPEQFLEVKFPKVNALPIKGTRKLGLGEELLASAKDRAENVMIVDLLRNDLNRICRRGSVKVKALCRLQTLPSLHHLVSEIEGELATRESTLPLLRAAFPGGSITGAPKIRVMEIIEQLEKHQRGPYCGSLFYWDTASAKMDSNILIRTILKENEKCYAFAGGGIVYDSILQEEYEECLLKIRSFLGEAFV